MRALGPEFTDFDTLGIKKLEINLKKGVDKIPEMWYLIITEREVKNYDKERTD